MKCFILRFTVLGLTLLATPMTAFASTSEIAGFWQSGSKNVRIEIADCGDGTPCGTIVWMNPAHNPALFDVHNPDKSLRGEKLIGMKILWGFKAKKTGWKSGKVYDPENGNTYSSRLKMGDDGGLVVKGCIGPICKTRKWSRVNHAVGLAEK